MPNFELEFHTKILRAFHELSFLRHFEIHARRDPLVLEFTNYQDGRNFGGFRACERHGLQVVTVACADNHDVEFKHADPQQALSAALRYWSAWYKEGHARGYDYGPGFASKDNYLEFKRLELPENIVRDHVETLVLDTPRLSELQLAVRFYDALDVRASPAVFVELRSKDPDVVTPFFAVDVLEFDRRLVLRAYNLCDAHVEGYCGPLSGLVLDGFSNKEVSIDFEPGASLYESCPRYDTAMASINAWLTAELDDTADWFTFS